MFIPVKSGRNDNNTAQNRSQYQRMGDPALGLSLLELETMLEEQLKEQVTQNNSTLATDVNDKTIGLPYESNEEGVFLDTDAYLQASREWLMPDGSLSQLPNTLGQDDDAYRRVVAQILQPAPMSPDVVNMPYSLSDTAETSSSDDSDGTGTDRSPPTMQDLLQAMNNREKLPKDSESLHEQIFRQEQAYLRQSQLFRESLLDPTLSQQARIARHCEEYQKRVQRAQQQLYDALGDFEGPDMSIIACQVCGCSMSPVEQEQGHGVCSLCHAQDLGLRPTTRPSKRTSYKTPPATKTPDNVGNAERQGTYFPPSYSSPSTTASASSSWIQMEDPDTGEIFYWNENTEEMKWDLD